MYNTRTSKGRNTKVPLLLFRILLLKKKSNLRSNNMYLEEVNNHFYTNDPHFLNKDFY